MTITCNGCEASWTALGAAHCGACHETFASAGLFDAHRSAEGPRGSCARPAELVKQAGVHAGERVMFFRDGMWRGPEMDDAAKAKAFGAR